MSLKCSTTTCLKNQKDNHVSWIYKLEEKSRKLVSLLWNIRSQFLMWLNSQTNHIVLIEEKYTSIYITGLFIKDLWNQALICKVSVQYIRMWKQ